MSEEKEACQKCGTILAETGAPIWESYCPNKDCTHDRDVFFASFRTAKPAEVATALRKARNDALEEAAKVAENYKTMDHIAWDGHIGIFPKSSTVPDYLAAAIRALKDKSQ